MKENACTHCEGNNKSCTYCQGKGYILTKEMIGLTERIRITRREHIDFLRIFIVWEGKRQAKERNIL